MRKFRSFLIDDTPVDHTTLKRGDDVLLPAGTELIEDWALGCPKTVVFKRDVVRMFWLYDADGTIQVLDNARNHVQKVLSKMVYRARYPWEVPIPNA